MTMTLLTPPFLTLYFFVCLVILIAVILMCERVLPACLYVDHACA